MTSTLRTTWTGLLTAQFLALPLPFLFDGVVASTGGMTLLAASAGALAFAALVHLEARFARLLDERETQEVEGARVERTLAACWRLAAAVGALGLLVGALTGSALLASPFLALAAMAIVETRPNHPKLVPAKALSDDASPTGSGWRTVAIGVALAGTALLVLHAVL